MCGTTTSIALALAVVSAPTSMAREQVLSLPPTTMTEAITADGIGVRLSRVLLARANLAAIIANRGYYYTPHLIKQIEGRDSIDARFYERHYTMVDSIHFVPIVEGMWQSVNVSGTSRGAYIEGLDVCGKTGTAEHHRKKTNGYYYPDHSTFLSFAPKDNPQIAISVYVEYGGFGSTTAVPIASLIEALYLTDTITRPELVERVKNAQLDYGAYDW